MFSLTEPRCYTACA